MEDLRTIKKKVEKYKKILHNTESYREDWKDGLKEMISSTLESIADETGLPASVEVQDKINNLEAIVFDLGRVRSGISEKVDEDTFRPMIKHNGALVYQQLFNGKVIVMVMLPFIEGYGEAKPPKTIEILRPEELKKAFIFRHVESFLRDVTGWEDYDDDLPEQKVGFNPIGFQMKQHVELDD